MRTSATEGRGGVGASDRGRDRPGLARQALALGAPSTRVRGAVRGRWGARVRVLVLSAVTLGLGGCEQAITGEPWTGDGPPPPRLLEGGYFAGGVDLSWELDPQWRNETFRVYNRRSGQANYVRVAEVTSCVQGLCAYRDVNVEPGRSYEYYVASWSPESGLETASEYAVEVVVPEPVAPPVPGGVRGIALDNAAYLVWDASARNAEDFSFYRVYLEGADDTVLLLGETDSEGFLDLLVENGSTYGYFVTAVDAEGHESGGSTLAEVTPRPDFHGEFLYAFEDQPARSGFRFPDSDATDPVLPGSAPNRDFRIEVDAEGWWLVPAPGVQVHRVPIATTSLRCGPAADPGCTEVTVAPSGNYSGADIGLAPGFSYVIRVPDQAGNVYHGVVRVTHTGVVQDGAIVILDWAFQLQPGNPSLTVIQASAGSVTRP